MSTFSALKPPKAAPPRAENESYSEIPRNVNFFNVKKNAGNLKNGHGKASHPYSS